MGDWLKFLMIKKGILQVQHDSVSQIEILLGLGESTVRSSTGQSHVLYLKKLLLFY